MGSGVVYIVGAGPGDPALLTLKALECLRKADVVVYDRLSNLQLLSHVRGSAELVYAGKEPGNHHLTQTEINSVIVEKALEGKVVVRLHGGDPFVFGRGGEEAEALRKRGIRYEVVPGISSSVSVPAYGGFPVTDRRCASSFAVFTGNQKESTDSLQLDWSKVSHAADTLIFLMGVANLNQIVSQLISHGKPPQTPAALIQWGTTSQQKTVTAPLVDLPAEAQKEGVSSPAVILVGDVVRLHKDGAWRDYLPLSGKRVLITRPLAQAHSMAELVMQYGGEPLIFPVIEVEKSEDLSLLDRKIQRISEFQWLVFTSANGVDVFFERLFYHHRKDVRYLHGVKVAVIGEATAARARQYGVVPDLVPDDYRAEALAAAICRTGENLSGQRVLIPRAAGARDVLIKDLEAKGAQVEEVRTYRVVTSTHAYFQEVRRRLVNGLSRPLDFVTFTSSSIVHHFVEALGKEKAVEICSKAAVACIGPITAQSAQQMGLPVQIVADKYDTASLVSAIARHCNGGA